MTAPIPCAHCGYNYMRTTLDPEVPKLCNNCTIRESNRVPKRDTSQDGYISVIVKMPTKEYAKLEEYCAKTGVNLSKYFMSLYDNMQGKAVVAGPLDYHDDELQANLLETIETGEKTFKLEKEITQQTVEKQIKQSSKKPKKKGKK